MYRIPKTIFAVALALGAAIGVMAQTTRSFTPVEGANLKAKIDNAVLQGKAAGMDVSIMLDLDGHVTEGPGFSAFVLDDGTVYQTYGTTARGLEFLMGYYGILDRTPKGRDEGDASQMWIRRHDEY